MISYCSAPDAELGVVLRLSRYLDCQARVLGENGFQILAGGPLVAGLLSSVLTIFVALIGYRFLLGGLPTLRDGFGWAFRVGFVLALATSWPAYQTLVYRVATDAPGDLAAILLPAAGLPSTDLDQRVQQAYDLIRVGTTVTQPQAAYQTPVDPSGQTTQSQIPQPATPGAQAPMPQTASMLVVSTAGMAAASKLVIGFLLAIGPVVAMSLLFDATLGIFSGWVRALAGVAFALLTTTIVTAVGLVMIESELARVETYGAGGITTAFDSQAVATLVFVFSLASIVAALMALRLASAFNIPPIRSPWSTDDQRRPPQFTSVEPSLAHARSPTSAENAAVEPPTRVTTMSDALLKAVRRERGEVLASNQQSAPERTGPPEQIDSRDGVSAVQPIGVAGRRSATRPSRSAGRRDGRA